MSMNTEGLKKLPHNHLAEGEVSGHYHAALGVSDLYEDSEGTLFFDASQGGVKVAHQEHKTIELPAKEMAAGRTREQDHFANEARAVQD